MLHFGPGHGLSRVGLAEMPGRNVMTHALHATRNPCYPVVEADSARVTAHLELIRFQQSTKKQLPDGHPFHIRETAPGTGSEAFEHVGFRGSHNTRAFAQHILG